MTRSVSDRAALPAPLVRAATRRIVVSKAAGLSRFVDGMACAPGPAPVRVILLLELAYRACLAAASLSATTSLSERAVRDISERRDATQLLLAGGLRYRQRCSDCGRPFPDECTPMTARLDGLLCEPGRCAPATGWENTLPATEPEPTDLVSDGSES
jgi:hypothetical protein